MASTPATPLHVSALRVSAPSLPRRALLGAAAVVLASAGIATAASPASVPALVQLPTVQLAHLDLLSSVAAPADQVLSLGIALKRPDAAGEDALFKRMYTPGNPDYRHFLTPQQFAQRFGVPVARVNLVRNLLASAGLSITNVSGDGSYVSAAGTIAQVEKAFGVTEKLFTLPATATTAASTFLANTAAPTVPLAAGITTIVGLNTFQRFGRMATAAPAQDLCLQGTCTGATTPQDMWSVYSQPDAYQGQGGSIGIIGEGVTAPAIANLRAAEKVYGLPQVPITVKCVQGALPSGDCAAADDGGTGEWNIDLQASTGMAPKIAGETLYWSKTIYDGDINNSFVSWINDASGPKVASASLGECEAGPLNGLLTSPPFGSIDGNLNGNPLSILALGNGEAKALDPLLKNAAMQGKTLFASTGDTGSSCPVVYLPELGAGNGVLNQVLPQQNYPAVSPYVVAVGGTVLYTHDNGESSGSGWKPGQPKATRAQEIAWTHGGGGASLYIPAPDWQKPVANNNHPCLVSADGTTGATGKTCRGVPDISAQSGDILTNGYSLVTTDGKTTSFTQGGGTSLSAPLVAGMWTRVAAASHYTLGFASPLLYKSGINAAAAKRDYTDVTLGLNGLYTAGPGWDYVTGFGTPLVDGLICDIAGLPSGRFSTGIVDICPLGAKPGVKLGGTITTLSVGNAIHGSGSVIQVRHGQAVVFKAALRLGKGVTGRAIAKRKLQLIIDRKVYATLTTGKGGTATFQRIALAKGTHTARIKFVGSSDLLTSASHILTIKSV